MGIMDIDFMQIIIKTTITFLVLFMLTRLLGKKQLSHLTFFNYVTGITIGSIAANIISNIDKPMLSELFGMIWWYVLTAILGLLGLKIGSLRNIIDGQPTIVIKKGMIEKKALKKNSLNMDDLFMMLREQNVFSIKDIDYAILEPDGKLSVMQKLGKQQVTKEDMQIKTQDFIYFSSEIIVDGKIIKNNLQEFGLDENWLQSQLKKKNIQSEKDILYAELQRDGSLYIQAMKKRSKSNPPRYPLEKFKFIK